MPQGGTAKKTQPNTSDNNRPSSNTANNKPTSTPPDTSEIDENWDTPANDNSLTRQSKRLKYPPDTPTEKRTPQKPPSNKILRKTEPSTPKITPRLTGAGSALPISKKSKKSPSRSVGPQAIVRLVSPIQMASRLQANQQRARLDNAPGTGPTREEMLADAGAGGDPILPGQFDPLKSQSAFGREAQAPGSMSTPTKSETDERGGGPVMSDLERQRAMQLSQEKMAATASATGVADAKQTDSKAESPATVTSSAETTSPSTKVPEQTEEEIEQTTEEQTPTDEKSPKKPSSDIQTAQNIASAMHMEKTAKALGAAKAIEGNIEAARKMQQSARSFWNILKAGELVSSVTIFSLIVLIITANIQMINKYTFKTRIIPSTYLIEDAIIVCADCALCGASCISIFTSTGFIIPIIGSLLWLAGVLGLDYFDIIDLGIL